MRSASIPVTPSKHPLFLQPIDPQELKRERFVAALGAAQSSLYRHIFSLYPDSSRVDDILQETNIILWRKVDEFDESRDFMPWARTIARYQVLAAMRDQSRDPLVMNEELINLVAADSAPDSGKPVKLQALEVCLGKLSGRKRDLILQRYRSGASVEHIANSMKRPVGSISQALYRIRKTLLKCIERETTSLS